MSQPNREGPESPGVGTPGTSPLTIPLTLIPLPNGGYVVRCPVLADLITEGDTEAEAIENAWDALLAILDGRDQLGEPLPFDLPVQPDRSLVHFGVSIEAHEDRP